MTTVNQTRTRLATQAELNRYADLCTRSEWRRVMLALAAQHARNGHRFPSPDHEAAHAQACRMFEAECEAAGFVQTERGLRVPVGRPEPASYSLHGCSPDAARLRGHRLSAECAIRLRDTRMQERNERAAFATAARLIGAGC